MKTRSKLLLAAVSLLTVSVAATATSAYAWYAANRQVQATVSSLGVQSTTGSLNIAHDTDIKQTSTTKINPSNYTLTYSTSEILTDVSSKGDGKFTKPKWDASGSTGSTNCVGSYGQEGEDPNKKVTLYGSTKAYGVVSLGIKFTNDGTANVSDDLVVYLDPTVTVEASESENKMSHESVIKSARFSICDVDSHGDVSDVYLYGNPKSKQTADSSNETNSYVTSASAGSLATTAVTSTVVDQSNLFIDNPTRVTDPTEENKVPTKGYLCTIPANQSKSYLITMWVEGTDADCVFSNAETPSFEVSGLSLGLGFYALTAAPTQQGA